MGGILAVRALVRKVIKRCGYDLVRVSSLDAGLVERNLIDLLDILADQLVSPARELTFVQVGAFDGHSHDPLNRIIRRRRASGVLVEPQPRAFDALRRAYGDKPDLRFENCAIADRDGEIEFFMLRDDAPDDLPVWLHQSASLDRAAIAANLRRHFRGRQGGGAAPPEETSLIESRRIVGMTWETLLEKHQIAQLDLLVMDTMGLDCRLLSRFPFERLKPRIIHFEHALSDRGEVRECLDLLERNGYSLAKVAVDTIACLDVPVRTWPVAGW